MKFKYEMASTVTTSTIEIETKNLKQAYDKAAEKLAVPLDTVYALGAKPCH
jgi:tRNA A37 threonylcarbamoyladenosine synthetase subunit TsaC/SUA5/YrdC